MRAFNAFALVVVAALLLMLPLTLLIYDFRTDPWEQDFNLSTAVGATTANCTLGLAPYSTGSFYFSSNVSSDIPAYSSYNATSQELELSGLTANCSHLVTVGYDIGALTGFDAIEDFLDTIPWLWILVIVAIPPCGLAAILIGRR